MGVPLHSECLPYDLINVHSEMLQDRYFALNWRGCDCNQNKNRKKRKRECDEISRARPRQHIEADSTETSCNALIHALKTNSLQPNPHPLSTRAMSRLVVRVHQSATPPSRFRTVDASDESMPPNSGLRSCFDDCLSQHRTAPPCVPRMSEVQSSERYMAVMGLAYL